MIRADFLAKVMLRRLRQQYPVGYRWRSRRDASESLHPTPSGMGPSAASGPASAQPGDFANGIHLILVDRSALPRDAPQGAERCHGNPGRIGTAAETSPAGFLAADGPGRRAESRARHLPP